MDTVLIYRLGSLGDTVLCLPAFHRIAAEFADARRIVVTNRPVSPAAPRLADILLDSGLAHDTIDYPVGSRSPFELGALWFKLRRSGADTLVYLTAARGLDVVRRDIRFMRACGIRRVIGAPVTPDLQVNKIDPVTGEEEQECARLVRNLAELGPIDLDDRANWDLRLTPSETAAAQRHLAILQRRPFIAINMGGKAVQNDWGQANWQQLVEAINQAFPGMPLVFVGADGDAERATRATHAHPELGLNLCGKLKPRETAAVLAKARLFIGHDSGPLHLAAACNVPCVGIYSNLFKPRKWHPYGAQHRIIHPSGPISTVSVDSVWGAVFAALRVEASA